MLKTILSILLLSSLSLAVGPVLKTGQTKSYDADGNVITDGSIKDDGYYQSGKARSYTRSGTGVVRDNATGLEWQDDVDSREKQWLSNDNYANCIDDPNSPACSDTSGDTATTYCNNLTLDDGGWRLPNIEELETLLYYPRSENWLYINSDIFQHTAYNAYWTDTAGQASFEILFADFNMGVISSNLKNITYPVRCVRGVSSEASSFSRDQNGIVTDHENMLQWQDDYSDNNEDIKKTNWESAINYCENLILDSNSDWRLPNENELLSIVDRKNYYPSINSAFQNTHNDFYWSSTTDGSTSGSTYLAWIINFSNGFSGNQLKTDDYHVRCVRGGQFDNSTNLSSVIMYLLN